MNILLPFLAAVLFDAAESRPEAVRSQDGATFRLEKGLLKVHTEPSDSYPGIQLRGDWDLSGCGSVDVEFVDGGIHGKYTLRMLNEGGAVNNAGSYVAKLPIGGEREKTCSAKLPPEIPGWRDILAKLTRVRTWALPFMIWNDERDGIAMWNHGSAPDWDTLERRGVRELAIYLNKPRLAHDWAIRRIVTTPAVKPDCDFPAFAKLGPEKFFPCIDRYGQFKHREWPGKVRSDDDLKAALAAEAKDLAAHPGAPDRDQWGGWAAGPKVGEKGGFFTVKWNGKWWITDPDGNLWWSHGVVRVTPSGGTTAMDGHEDWFEGLPAKDSDEAWAYSTGDELLRPYYPRWKMNKVFDFSALNIARKYGKDWYAKWADLAHVRLKSWGVNTIANSSDMKICLMDRTPYTERYEVHARAIAGHKGGWWDFCDPFDPSFRAEAKRQTVVYRKEFEDPWCIGFFVDNEHFWGQADTLALSTLKSPADQPCKKVFRERLQAKYGEIDKLNAAWKTAYRDWDDFLAVVKTPDPKAAKADLEAFTTEIAENYYRIIREELKAAAPGKLYLGCRWAGSAPEFTVRAAAKYCDVLSYNIYRRHLREFKLPEGVDKPVMVGEFHFGALDRGPFCPGLILLRDQAERGRVYEDYVTSALEHPNFVGVHWHQFSDQATSGRFDGENMQVGWTDICDTPYPETIDAIRRVGYRMYSIRAAQK